MNPPLSESDRNLTAADVGIWARLYRIDGLYALSIEADRRDYELMLAWCIAVDTFETHPHLDIKNVIQHRGRLTVQRRYPHTVNFA